VGGARGVSLYVRQGGVYKLVDFDDLYRRNGGVYSKMKELYVKHAGVYKLVWRADGPPPPPSSLGIAAVNGGVINVGWAWAANEEGDYNRVEVQQPGDIARIGTNYPGTTQQRTGYAHGTSVVLEARTVDNGGQFSAWTPVPVTGALNALPGPASFSAFWWDGTNFQLQWTDPGNPYGDISAVQLWYRADHEGTWTLGATHGTAGGLRQWALPGRGWDVLNHAFIRVVNNAGYTDSGILSVWTPPQPGTEKTLAAYIGDSWGYNAGGYRNDGTVRQGQFSPTPWGTHYGMFFYGANALWNMGHGYQAASGEIFMIRHGTEGFTGTVWFEPHGYGSPPGFTPSGLDQQWASTSEFAGHDASAWEPIPGYVLASIANGSAQGMGIFTGNTAQSLYKVFKGPSLNGFAGVVRLRW
jgi:hypothetical protein